jgi:hypothetical protein
VQTGISLLLSSTIVKIFFPGVAPSFDINLYMEPSSGRRFHPLKATKCEKKRNRAFVDHFLPLSRFLD